MEVKFHDRRAIRLSAIRPGQIAVACLGVGMQGKRPIYTKVYCTGPTGANYEQIIQLDQLTNQYLDKVSPDTAVVLLEKGESVEFIQT